jgi:hypothetical protein
MNDILKSFDELYDFYIDDKSCKNGAKSRVLFQYCLRNVLVLLNFSDWHKKEKMPRKIGAFLYIHGKTVDMCHILFALFFI